MIGRFFSYHMIALSSLLSATLRAMILPFPSGHSGCSRTTSRLVPAPTAVLMVTLPLDPTSLSTSRLIVGLSFMVASVSLDLLATPVNPVVQGNSNARMFG